MEKLLTVPEVAVILQVKPSTVYTWVREGKIPHIRVGRLIRFRPLQIEEFISRNGHGRRQKVSPSGVDRGQSCL